VKQGRRELVVAAAAAALLGVGVVADVLSEEVGRPPQREPSTARFSERAIFCPPLIRGARAVRRFYVGSTGDQPIEIGVEPGEPSSLDPEVLAVAAPEGQGPVDIIGYGGRVAAGAVVGYSDPVRGTAAARCSSVASEHWYFPSGTSLLGFDERILLYNPFPDEAVAKVSFLTPSGERAPANLVDVGVPAGNWTEVKVNDFVGPKQRLLSAHVATVRGRLIAWRVLISKGKDLADGVESTLGATDPSTNWYFPQGRVESGVRQKMTLMNPSSEEAVVTISLVTESNVIQPDALAEIAIPPKSARSFDVGRALDRRHAELGGASTLVQSTNGVEIVGERTVVYDQPESVTSEIGAPLTAAKWLLPPATATSATDHVVVMNGSSGTARITIALWRADGGQVTPRALRNLRVRAGLRRDINVSDYTAGRPMIALVTATDLVVAERAGLGIDVAAVMGIPLDFQHLDQ